VTFLRTTQAWKLAGATGLEPATPCELRSNSGDQQLSPSSRPYLLGAVDIPVLFCHDLRITLSSVGQGPEFPA